MRAPEAGRRRDGRFGIPTLPKWDDAAHARAHEALIAMVRFPLLKSDSSGTVKLSLLETRCDRTWEACKTRKEVRDTSLSRAHLKLDASGMVKLALPQYSSSRSAPRLPAVAACAQPSMCWHMTPFGCEKAPSTCGALERLQDRHQEIAMFNLRAAGLRGRALHPQQRSASLTNGLVASAAQIRDKLAASAN